MKSEPLTKDKLIESLASLEHEQWMYWTKAIIEKLKIANTDSENTEVKNNTEVIIKILEENWKRNWIPYADLSDKMKEHDRKWARMAYKLCEKDLKSALEEFERLIRLNYFDPESEILHKEFQEIQPIGEFNLFLLKKAFPAIYESEEK